MESHPLRRAALVAVLIAATWLLSRAASAAPLAQATATATATPTATYTPMPTRTPTATPWTVEVISVEIAGTQTPLGVLHYEATAGELIVAFLLIAVIILLITLAVWLYRARK